MPTVLVIDNQMARSRLIQGALEANGYETQVVSSMREAADRMRQEWLDAVVTIESTAEGAVEPGGLGRILCANREVVDLVHLDTLLYLATRELHPWSAFYAVGPVAAN